MRLKGKIDWWFYVLAVMANIAIIATGVVNGLGDTGSERLLSTFVTLAVLVIINIFFVPILMQNYVELGDSSMLIVFGFMNTEIAYSGITAAAETTNFFSSWAASLDRVRISGRAADIMIAVQDKQTLFAFLKKKNPAIRIELR